MVMLSLVHEFSPFPGSERADRCDVVDLVGGDFDGVAFAGMALSIPSGAGDRVASVVVAAVALRLAGLSPRTAWSGVIPCPLL
jgi:hypothetical protein